MLDKWSGKDNVMEMQWLNPKFMVLPLLTGLQCPQELKQSEDDIFSGNVWFCPAITCQNAG